MTSFRRAVKIILMKKIYLYIFLVLMFSVFTSHSFAETKIKYKTYKKLPCKFNGAILATSANASLERSKRCKESKNKGYEGKKGTSIWIERGTPVFAITNMKLLVAKDRSAKKRCTILNESHKKTGCDIIYDDIELLFEDKSGNHILYYHLKETPFVPGFGKGKCERPEEFGTETEKRSPQFCGGFLNSFEENNFEVKKGDLIGFSGTTGSNQKGDPHISLGVSVKYEDFSSKNKKLCKIKRENNKECKQTYKPISCYDNRCWVAAEDYFKWENYPTDSDAFLLPIMSKKYLKEIGYKN